MGLAQYSSTPILQYSCEVIMSSKLRLSVACGDYEIIRALKEGTVQADGLDLVILTAHGPRERHWRMARNLEYDVCEFIVDFATVSLSSMPTPASRHRKI